MLKYSESITQCGESWNSPETPQPLQEISMETSYTGNGMLQHGTSFYSHFFFHLTNTEKCESLCMHYPCSTPQWIFLGLFLPSSQHNCAAVWADHKNGCADMQYSTICQDGGVCKPVETAA